MGFLANLLGGGNQTAAMLDAGAVVIDVRTPGEFRSGHVKGSVNIPLDTLDAEIDRIRKMNKPVVLCCASGMRSARATAVLKGHGITCCNGGSWTRVQR